MSVLSDLCYSSLVEVKTGADAKHRTIFVPTRVPAQQSSVSANQMANH